MDRRSMTPGISSRLSSPPPAAHPSPPPAAAPSAAATPSHPPSPTPDAFTRLEESFSRFAEKWDQFVVMFHRYKEKIEKEFQAALRLQTTARGATPWPSSHEQAVVRLQAAVRGFLVRRAVRKLHLLISSSLHQLAACAPNHQVSSILFEPPVEVEIWDNLNRIISGNFPYPVDQHHLDNPHDYNETVAVIGRYISENYNGVALHPIDFIDTSSGKLLAEVMDPDIITISPVNKLHPQDDILATGSSRSIFIWKPKTEDELTEERAKQKAKEYVYGSSSRKKPNGKHDNSSDDDSGGDSGGKNKKAKKTRFTHAVKGKGKSNV
uniref:Uncharacterized protein n=1 Tax=Zea mays TaxID=4577 RepID=A0A804P2Q0_MAIZE